MSEWMSTVALRSVAMVALVVAGSAEAAPARSDATDVFALVIGTSRSPRSSDGILRFADDDAARFHEIIGSTAVRARLLAVLDADSQELFPEAAAGAVAPTRKNVTAALEQLFAEIRAANAKGRRTAFYFVYAGHGGIGSGNEGEIYLTDGPFRRSELYRDVIKPSPATVNHVIIDACQAYFMVNRRGEGGEVSPEDYRDAIAAYLSEESLDRYPNTGVVVSTSGDAEVHEWSEFSGGVFGHEVRSAMLGAADADLDGAVEYSEMAAFIAAANHRVDNPRARLDVFARAPKVNLKEPLFRPAAMKNVMFLTFDVDAPGRYWIEDERGVRVTDLHPTADQPVRVALPAGRGYFVRLADAEAGLEPNAGSRVALSELTFKRRKSMPRGALTETLRRGLFREPFSRGFLAAFSKYGSPARSAPAAGATAPERPLRVAEKRRSSVAVVDIAGTGLEEQLKTTLTEVLTTELHRLDLFDVVSGRDITMMLSFEAQKTLLGCDDTTCLAELGGALGVDRLVASHIGKVGKTYVVNIKVINIREVHTEDRVYESITGQEDQLLATIRSSVTKLLGPGSKIGERVGVASPEKVAEFTPHSESAPKPTDESPAVAATAEPPTETSEAPKSSPWPWVSGAVAALAGGGSVLFGLRASSDRQEGRDIAASPGEYFRSDLDSAQDSFDSNRRLAFVMGGVAAAAAAGAVVLWLIGGSDEPEPGETSEPGAGVSATILPGGAALLTTVTF